MRPKRKRTTKFSPILNHNYRAAVRIPNSAGSPLCSSKLYSQSFSTIPEQLRHQETSVAANKQREGKGQVTELIAQILHTHYNS